MHLEGLTEQLGELAVELRASVAGLTGDAMAVLSAMPCCASGSLPRESILHARKKRITTGLWKNGIAGRPRGKSRSEHPLEMFPRRLRFPDWRCCCRSVAGCSSMAP